MVCAACVVVHILLKFVACAVVHLQRSVVRLGAVAVCACVPLPSCCFCFGMVVGMVHARPQQQASCVPAAAGGPCVLVVVWCVGVCMLVSCRNKGCGWVGPAGGGVGQPHLCC